MGHKLLDGHLTPGRNQLSINWELHACEFRKIFGHWIPKMEGAFLVEDHRRDGSDWLGHGEDTEQRIGFHWSGIFKSVAAGCLKVHDLSVARDQRYSAYQISVGNLALYELGDLS